jgi:hypothetical protein
MRIPTAVINDAHLDWNIRYKPYEQKIAGFTNTVNDQESVKAFMFHWSPRGDGVEMLFKPQVGDPRWLGRDHQPESPGFFMLLQTPPGRPEIIEGNTRIMAKQYLRELTGASVKRQIAAYQGENDADLSINWLHKCVTDGSIPYTVEENGDEDADVSEFGSWGPNVKVGIPGRLGSFQVMRDDLHPTDDSFWMLPPDLQLIANDIDARAVMEQHRELVGIANVRYARESPVVAREFQQQARERASRIPVPESHDVVRENPCISGSLVNRSVPEPVADQPNVVCNLNEQEFNSIEVDPARPLPKQWGVEFDNCKVNHFAVCHEEFEDGHGGSGINIYKVKDVCKEQDATGQPVEYFTTRHKLRPSTKNVFVYDVGCLTSKWHMERLKEDMNVRGWQVVYYFEKLTKGGKIPRHKEILKLAEEHRLELFRPPDGEREFADPMSPDSCDDSSEDDDDDADDDDNAGVNDP